MRPVRGCQLGLKVRCRKLTWPMKTMPMTITTTPATRRMTSAYWVTKIPTVPTRSETARNTAEKPAMNRPTPASILLRVRSRPLVTPLT